MAAFLHVLLEDVVPDAFDVIEIASGKEPLVWMSLKAVCILLERFRIIVLRIASNADELQIGILVLVKHAFERLIQLPTRGGAICKEKAADPDFAFELF